MLLGNSATERYEQFGLSRVRLHVKITIWPDIPLFRQRFSANHPLCIIFAKIRFFIQNPLPFPCILIFFWSHPCFTLSFQSLSFFSTLPNHQDFTRAYRQYLQKSTGHSARPAHTEISTLLLPNRRKSSSNTTRIRKVTSVPAGYAQL